MNNSLVSRRYHELVDITKVKKLITMINNDELKLERYENNHKNESRTELYERIKVMLMKYQSKIKNNSATVMYDYTIPNFGRVYAKGKYCSIGSMPREIRGTLAQDHYVDIDINNCHPVLMVQLCDKYNIECNELRNYVKNRDEYLKRVMDDFQVDRDAAKVLFLQLMYGGSYKSWCTDHDIDKKIPNWLNDFISDIVHIYPELLKHYEKEIELLQKNDKPSHDYNKNAALISWILQDTECQILSTMLDCLGRYGKAVTHCILCFDGFMMKKEKYSPELLTLLEDEIYKKMNFSIKLSTKKFTTIELKDNDESEEEDNMYIAPYTSYFDIDVFNRCSNHSFASAKEYFERFNRYNNDGDNILVYDGERKVLDIVTIKRAQDKYRNLFDYSLNKEKYELDSFPNFFREWMASPMRRHVISMDCIPYSDTISINRVFENNIANTFIGFNKLISSFNPEYENDFNDFYENYFLKLLFNCCECNEEFANWMLCYFAQLIQHPEKRPLRSVCFVGNQGDGKNALLDAIANVIGKDLYHSSSKISDYFGEHACAHQGKLLINFDEAQAKGNYDLEGMIKSFVTSAFIDINEKFVKQYRVTNNARLICTSNKLNTLPIDFESGNRRFVLFHTTNPNKTVHCKEHIDYFNHYYKIIESDFYPAYMYRKLMSIDISNWNSQQELKTYQEGVARSLAEDTFTFFIREDIDNIREKCKVNGNYYDEDKDVGYITRDDLFDIYKQFCISSNFSNTSILNRKFFNQRIKDYKFIDHSDKRLPYTRIRCLGIDFHKYNEYLEKKCEFYENSNENNKTETE